VPPLFPYTTLFRSRRTGLDDDRVQAQPGSGQALQRRVESAGVVQAAQATAGDRRRIGDLTHQQTRVDADVAEVIDDDAEPGPRLPQDMIQQAGLARTEVAGERDHWHGVHAGTTPPSR